MDLNNDKVADINDDNLGRKEFANEITKQLLYYANHNSSGLTLSINGEWGSGKSTLLSFIKKIIEDKQDKRYKIIEFNPWIIYKEGNIKESFLIHFALSLKDTTSKSKAISKRVGNYIDAFQWVKYIHPLAGDIQSGLKNITDLLSKNESITKIKTDIEALLKESNKKIFILIDDIDRLTRSEIVELFQIISLVADFSNVFYLIAYDKEIVANAINNQYKDKGFDYLEKIVQIDYPVPPIKKETLNKLFFDSLDDLSKELKFKYDKIVLKSLWDYHGMNEYFTSLRDYKRYFNSLKFRLPIIHNDINVNDFIAFEAIRIFDNVGYNAFYLYYSSSLRRRNMPEGILKPEEINKLNQPTQDILKAIFPKSSLYAIRSDVNDKRIYDPQFFERYFSLLRNESDISESDFKEFIKRPESRNNILQSATKYNRLKDLLNRLEDESMSKHFSQYDFNIITILITFFNNNPKEFQEYSTQASNAIISLLCNANNKQEYIKSFFLTFKSPDSFPSLVHIYLFHYIRLFKKDNRLFINRYPEFDNYYKNNFEQIIGWFIPHFNNSFQSMLRDKVYVNECPFIVYLYLINYSQLFNSEYIRAFESLKVDRAFILFVIKQLITLDKNSELDRVEFQFIPDILPEQIRYDFINVVRQIVLIEVDNITAAYIKGFLKAVDSGAIK
ncbi:MAG TPA: P-loop NTPase fold protein [Parafilimonas sp.]|nr:P-loop NTPase fold protein [Parafilimonas sp.]